MPLTQSGQNAYGIYKKSGYKTVGDFLKDNPSFAAKGGPRDYEGLTGDIQVGQEYKNYVAPITPTVGSGTYVPDLANSIDQNAGTTPTTPTTIGTSDALRAQQRKQEIERIKAEMVGDLTQPTRFNSVEEFDRLRTERGIVNDEAELQALQQEAMMGKQALREFSASAGEGVTEGGRLGMMSEKERNLNFRLEGLALREQAVVNRLNSKNAYIKTVLDLGEKDYQNAYTEYTNEYNKNLKAIELYNEELNDQQKDALTGLTTITGLLADKGVDLSTINPTVKAQIDTLSMQAGLPQGLIQEVMSISPQDKLQNVSTRTDASGNSYWDILKTRPDGSFYTQQVFKGTGGGDSGGGLTPAQINSTVNQIAGSFDNEQIVKDFNQATSQYQLMNSLGAESKNPGDDIAFVYAFAKLMDPNSVVREGEYATVQRYAQSFLDAKTLEAIRLAKNTNFLTADAKQKLLTTSYAKMQVLNTQYQNLYNQYQQRIDGAKSGMFNTLPDYSKAFNLQSPNKLSPSVSSQEEANKIIEDVSSESKPDYGLVGKALSGIWDWFTK